jgi:hypothetical protein
MISGTHGVDPHFCLLHAICLERRDFVELFANEEVVLELL